MHNGNAKPIPDIPTPPVQSASGNGQLGDVSSLSLGQR